MNNLLGGGLPFKVNQAPINRFARAQTACLASC